VLPAGYVAPATVTAAVTAPAPVPVLVTPVVVAGTVLRVCSICSTSTSSSVTARMRELCKCVALRCCDQRCCDQHCAAATVAVATAATAAAAASGQYTVAAVA
jgi:hypothetical protein